MMSDAGLRRFEKNSTRKKTVPTKSRRSPHWINVLVLLPVAGSIGVVVVGGVVGVVVVVVSGGVVVAGGMGSLQVTVMGVGGSGVTVVVVGVVVVTVVVVVAGWT